MSEWITDRLPTKEDALNYWVLVWHEKEGVMTSCSYLVEEGTPWQPITRPAPYVKPKRWTVEWDDCEDGWFLRQDGNPFSFELWHLRREDAEAAKEIEYIYNEVLP